MIAGRRSPVETKRRTKMRAKLKGDPTANIQVVSFFFESTINLEVNTLKFNSGFQVVKLHMNFGSRLNFNFLTSLLDKNPLQHTSHLHIKVCLSSTYSVI